MLLAAVQWFSWRECAFEGRGTMAWVKSDGWGVELLEDRVTDGTCLSPRALNNRAKAL